MGDRPEVEADEVTSVEGEHGPPEGRGVGEDVDVRNAPVRPTCLLNSQDIVAQQAQLVDDRMIEILVG